MLIINPKDVRMIPKITKTNKFAIILAGGVGSRFWPLSRELEPKQFLKLLGSKSLFQQTLERILPMVPPENIYIVGNDMHKFEIKRNMGNLSIPKANIILEPCGKNTAPAIGLAAKSILLKDPEAVMLVLPADHFIVNKSRFLKILKRAVLLAEKNFLVTLGIKPTTAHTGYGYIRIKSRIRGAGGYYIGRFVEKPDKPHAEKLFKSKYYFWNSGMFVWKAKIILAEIENHLPDLARKLQNINPANEISWKAWDKIKPISIDYGILEKSKQGAVIVANNIGWSDLGSWQALSDVLPKDRNENVTRADSVDIGSKNIAVFGNSRLIATIGIKDTVIADTDDAVLVCDKSRTEEVKNIVNIIKSNGRKEHSMHKTAKRPWGCYTTISVLPGSKVKLIQVEPHKRLSMQLHRYRSEHWVVVEGKAKITNNGEVYYLKPNQSTYIPKKTIHRLENPADSLLKIIEVQCGQYLEEDDIVRFDDDFGRRR